jgi:hypothetical protein
MFSRTILLHEISHYVFRTIKGEMIYLSLLSVKRGWDAFNPQFPRIPWSCQLFKNLNSEMSEEFLHI